MPLVPREPADRAERAPEALVLYIWDNQANVRLVQRILTLRQGVGA
ncbi:MAG: hypothetical protein M3P23_07765 [Actinomycetota bacterium]|nr:hypothetical protein [Actinomycetota bacterium]